MKLNNFIHDCKDLICLKFNYPEFTVVNVLKNISMGWILVLPDSDKLLPITHCPFCGKRLEPKVKEAKK